MGINQFPIVKLGKLLPQPYKNGIYKNFDSYGQGTSILRITDFNNEGNLVTDELQKLKLEPNEVENYRLSPKDIVVNRVNSLTHLGKSILWQETNGDVTVYESNMMRIQPDQAAILPEYLIRVLQSEPAREHFRKVAKRAVSQCSINQQDVKSLSLTTYQFNENLQYVIPAGIAGIQKPGMARLRSHPCVLDTGSPCRYDVL
ncbi:MAG: hypothetical protein QX199_03760, partial [Methylococcaceae bacterium]